MLTLHCSPWPEHEARVLPKATALGIEYRGAALQSCRGVQLFSRVAEGHSVHVYSAESLALGAGWKSTPE